MDDAYVRYLTSHSQGRLATIGPDGGPQNKPVGYRYNAGLGTIDIGGYGMERSAKYRNVGRDPNVAFVIDDATGEGAANMRFLEIRGRAEQAARALAAELQAGFGTKDADVSSRHFAADILWGSPFGATVHGYDDLHAIHVWLKKTERGGHASRFEVVSVLAPAPGVAVAQIRRTALDDQGRAVEPSSDLTQAFSEVALYVLVRRGGTWWLAAGQNTPVLPAPGRPSQPGPG
jgi:PPOX class F420-dependent enzyme/OxyR family protein